MTGKTMNPEDYYDEEGFLCCGKCHTRKQQMFLWPLFDGRGGREERLIKAMCLCEQEQDEKKRAAEDRRRHETRVDQLRKECFTGQRLRGCRFENADMISPDILEKAKTFVNGWETVKCKNSGLLLWGNIGTGKTYLAAAIANALIEQGVSVLMRTVADFMNLSFDAREALFRKVTTAGLLIIDDLGMERGTEFGLETTFEVINTRYESLKPTIMTTNLTLEELKKTSDTAHRRIYDRVLEMCVPLKVTGKSVRSGIHERKKAVLQEIFSPKEALGNGE